MNKLRVLQVLTSMDRGGAETMVMNYYRAIDKSQVQFDFLLHRENKGAYEDEIIALGGNIYRMPALGPKNYFKYLRNLSSFFEEHPQYRIIHSHMNAYSYWVLKVAKKKGIPVRIAHSHTSIEPFFKKIALKNTDLQTTFKDGVQSFMRYGVRKVASHYFACGKKAGEWLFGETASGKITVINNAVDSKKFLYNPEKGEEIKIQMGWHGQKVIGHVGNFVEAKNHAFLIKIFKDLLHLSKDIVLVLVGQGYLEEKIRQEVDALGIENKVHFLGVRSDIPDIMQAFDVFLFPSLYEGLPMTLIEAQSAGLKIFASNSISNEVNITGQIEFYSLDENSHNWANLIFKNLHYTRNNTYDRIVEANYDIKKNVEQLLEFYFNT